MEKIVRGEKNKTAIQSPPPVGAGPVPARTPHFSVQTNARIFGLAQGLPFNKT